jgi:signal transduction histidine kinase
VFPAEAELAIFRAVQEGLSNIARHAQAHRVDVRLGLEGDTIVLRLSDDGRGFASQPDLERLEHEGHMGLAGMRERITALGGEFRLHARPGHGVALEVRVPLNGDGNA